MPESLTHDQAKQQWESRGDEWARVFAHRLAASNSFEKSCPKWWSDAIETALRAQGSTLTRQELEIIQTAIVIGNAAILAFLDVVYDV